jgi:hypothetical protein
MDSGLRPNRPPGKQGCCYRTYLVALGEEECGALQQVVRSGTHPSRRIFNACAHEEKGARTIVEELNAEGIPSPRGTIPSAEAGH